MEAATKLPNGGQKPLLYLSFGAFILSSNGDYLDVRGGLQ